jgi:beta-1,4-mannosyltransferase
MKINVLVFPENRKVNPYQNLLYKDIMSIKDVKIKFFNASFFGHTRIPLGIFNFFIPIRLFRYRLEGYNIFHLHWFGPLHLPTENIILRLISTIYLMIFLIYVKYFLYYKIVWTIHEILPPRKEFIHDLLIRKFVANITDANIVQSKSTLDDLKKLKFNTLKTYLIPHGTYIGAYENIISKEQARKYFHLNPDDYVFLFLGTISKHKGLEYLLETFLKLPKKRNIKLLIAGENHFKNIEQLLNKYRSLLDNHIIIRLGFVP